MKTNNARGTATLAAAIIASVNDKQAGKPQEKTKPAEKTKESPAPSPAVIAGEKLFESLRPSSFKDDTKPWLVGDLSGANAFAARVADIRVIAACLLNKATGLPRTKEGTIDRDKLKTFRKSFSALKPDAREKWNGKAGVLFGAALRDYREVLKPIRKAVFSNAKFDLRSFRVSLAKKTGNVSVTSRLVCTQ